MMKSDPQTFKTFFLKIHHTFAKKIVQCYRSFFIALLLEHFRFCENNFLYSITLLADYKLVLVLRSTLLVHRIRKSNLRTSKSNYTLCSIKRNIDLELIKLNLKIKLIFIKILKCSKLFSRIQIYLDLRCFF